MSEYAILSFSDYKVLEMKNQVYPDVMTMFWEGDKKAYPKSVDGEEWAVFEYSTSMDKAIQRLEIMGFSLGRAREEFEAGIQALLREERLYDAERDLFGDFSFGIWLKCMRQIIETGVTKWNIDKRIGELDADLLPYVRFILDTFGFSDESLNLSPEFSVIGSFLYGFSVYEISYFNKTELPHTDMRFVFRSILEVCEEEDVVSVDYSWVISWGTYTEDEELCKDEHIEKTIVLVEGSTDRAVLEKTLQFLHPDLCRYYSFMDFHSSNIAGGASALVHTLKAFISAGIKNRVIAVFDNDTAATEALRALSPVDLPENIRVLRLPQLEFARNYPTIGPQGNVNANINGLACSIELYLGTDLLTDDDGNLTPVQWLGYNQTLKQYQGEILNKKCLQEQYLQLVTQAMQDPQIAERHDWHPMRLVLGSIFKAFV